ncbi:MAG: flagellar FliJ family protein [Bacteriovoracia bacterium]
MKRYQFRLEAVRKMRSMLEETCRSELGLLMVERQNLVEFIETLLHDIQSAYTEQETHMSKGMKASHAAFFPQAVSGKESKIKEIKKEIELLDAKIADKKVELTQKRADLKLMENLKEKDLQAWKKAFNKEENMKVEEMVQLWGENLKSNQEER